MCDDEQNKGYFVKEMTYEDAKRIAEELLMQAMVGGEYVDPEEIEYKDFLCKAIEALDKQIPKKPNIRYFDHFVRCSCAYCPTCGEPFGELYPQKGLLIQMMLAEKQAHCIGCGQAIDFTEVEE